MPPTRSRVPGLHSEALPVGTVIDWYRKDAGTPIPEGWQWCDGGLISDSRSDLDGINTPDLRDKFVRGKTDTTAGTSSGGSDTKNISHTHGPGTLKFQICGHSGGVPSFFNSAGTEVYPLGWSNAEYGAHHTDIKRNIYLNENLYTRVAGATGLTASGGSSSQDIIPAYVGLIKLIKIF